MDDERKQLLANLLEQARSRVKIRTRFSEATLSRQKYQELYQTNSYYGPDTKFQRLIFHPFLEDGANKNRLLDFMRDELRDYLDDKDRCSMCPITDPITDIVGEKIIYSLDYSLDEFVQGILKIAIIDGIEEAVSTVDECIRQNGINYQHVNLLDGIKIYDELKISDGIKLVPLPSSTEKLPDIFPYIPGIGTDNSGKIYTGRTLIITDRHATPRFHKPSGGIKHFQRKCKSTEFPDFNPVEFLWHLSLVSKHSIKPIMTWDYVSEREPLKTVIDKVSSFSHDLPNGRRSDSEISDKHITQAKDLYSKFAKLDEYAQNKLGIAIRRWIKAKGKNSEDRIINLVIAFEVIYLDGSKQQVSSNFRQRGAWYLGKNTDERSELLNLFKTIYECRSQAVHSGKVDTEQEIKSSKKTMSPEELLDEADKLCGNSIVKIIQEGGFPDWDKLVLGNHATEKLPAQRA